MYKRLSDLIRNTLTCITLVVLIAWALALILLVPFLLGLEILIRQKFRDHAG